MIYLFVAILSEVIATSALRATAGFTKLIPSIIVIFFYIIAFLCLSITVKSTPIGIAYAIWSGLGIVLVSIVSYFIYGQAMNLPTIIGIILILVGVLILNLFSKTIEH